MITVTALSEVYEGFFAAIARALISVFLSFIPGAKEWWKNSGWDKAVMFGICFLVVPMGCWILECVGHVDLPIYAPRCTFEGVVLDALYPGFLAYLFNWAGEEAFNWAKDRLRGNK